MTAVVVDAAKYGWPLIVPKLRVRYGVCGTHRLQVSLAAKRNSIHSRGSGPNDFGLDIS